MLYHGGQDADVDVVFCQGSGESNLCHVGIMSVAAPDDHH